MIGKLNMMTNDKLPSKIEADLILEQANNDNPGPWINHCKIVAKVAEIIAKNSSLNTDKAYVLGLLHDIGYADFRDYKARSCHVIIGYDNMILKGYDTVARICLSHSFPIKDIGAYGGTDTNWNKEEKDSLIKFLSETEYDDYDRLIQLCDSLGTAEGVCLIDKRMMGVVRRHGFSEFTVKKWNATFDLKDYFDDLCGRNIYSLFIDDIVKDILEN